MFKLHSDFKTLSPRDPAHPGTPVRTGKGFDVWQDKEGRLFLILPSGDRKHFDTADEAIAFATESLKK